MSRTLPITAATLVALLATLAGSAQAQPARDPRAVGPYRGLFGGNDVAADSRYVLDATFGAFAGYDDDVTRGQGSSPSNADAQAASTYAGAAAGMRYVALVSERVTFQADGQLVSSYYADLDDLVATSYGASAALSWRPTSRTSLSLRHRVRYTPFFGYSIFGATDIPESEDPAGVWSDTRVVRSENITNTSSLSIGRRLSERSTLSANASYRRTDFLDRDATNGDTERWGAGARWTYRLTEHLSSRLGYGYASADYRGGVTDSAANGIHLIDVGLDYGRALSFSRNTRFSFGMGTSGYATSTPVEDGTVEEFRYTAIGDAQLTHEIGQSWVAALFFSRRVRFFDGFADPFLTNAAGASIGGFLGPRTRLSLVAGFDWGEYGRSLDSRRDTRSTYVASSAQFALARNVAVQGTYYYYRYSFGEGAQPLPDGFLSRYARQGFRVGLSVWVPLYRAGVAP